jgi:hypothetical protein
MELAEGPVRKGMEKAVGKAVGDQCIFIAVRWSGWQIRAGSDAMPDTAGDESDHGPAEPDAVIHRYILNPYIAKVAIITSRCLEIIICS